ncbi:MAG: hypothetical protein GWP70_08925 [Proteobacteria bacterium]|nr:hypothetical protein [Pseudomonadota bacterium]
MKAFTKIATPSWLSARLTAGPHTVAALPMLLLALGTASPANAQRIITPLLPLSKPNQPADVIYRIPRIPTSDAGVYLQDVVCAIGVFGKEMRYSVVFGDLAGHPEKTLFVRTYQTDDHGFMRPWRRDNYRWHPFSAAQPDLAETVVELPDAVCDRATHIETIIVRGQRRVAPKVKCAAAACGSDP